MVLPVPARRAIKKILRGSVTGLSSGLWPRKIGENETSKDKSHVKVFLRKNYVNFFVINRYLINYFNEKSS